MTTGLPLITALEPGSALCPVQDDREQGEHGDGQKPEVTE
jgi:hypothetical protein